MGLLLVCLGRVLPGAKECRRKRPCRAKRGSGRVSSEGEEGEEGEEGGGSERFADLVWCPEPPQVGGLSFQTGNHVQGVVTEMGSTGVCYSPPSSTGEPPCTTLSPGAPAVSGENG